MKWTERELSILEDRYPKTPNKHLSDEILLKRTREAISRKARRMNLEKEPNFHFKWKVRQQCVPETDARFESFLCGITAGDGTFMRTKNGDNYKFVYKVEMNAEGNRSLIESIKDFFDCGRISTYYREEYDREVIRFSVQSLAEHIGCVIPVFDRNTMFAKYKKSQYDKWKMQLLDYIEKMKGADCRDYCIEVIENER